jgi:hypothetical protein
MGSHGNGAADWAFSIRDETEHPCGSSLIRREIADAFALQSADWSKLCEDWPTRWMEEESHSPVVGPESVERVVTSRNPALSEGGYGPLVVEGSVKP